MRPRADRGFAIGALVAAVVLGSSASAQLLRRESRPTENVARVENGRPGGAVIAPGVGSSHRIPLSGGAKHLIVQGTLNDALTGPLLIDTGASYCVVTRKTAERLGVTRIVGATVPVTTANGEVEADLVRLDSIQIEDARLAGVEAVVMDAVEPPLVGILGLSFLNKFRRYSVDQARGTIQLER